MSYILIRYSIFMRVIIYFKTRRIATLIWDYKAMLSHKINKWRKKLIQWFHHLQKWNCQLEYFFFLTSNKIYKFIMKIMRHRHDDNWRRYYSDFIIMIPIVNCRFIYIYCTFKMFVLWVCVVRSIFTLSSMR